MTAALDGLRGLPLVTVAAAEGFVVGGGAELLTATDLRFEKTLKHSLTKGKITF